MAIWANVGWAREGGWSLSVPTDNPSPQSHARTAALRASTLTRSVSVMSSALTTRVAVLTTSLSASPKVRSEWLGGPGTPLCTWRLTTTHPAFSDSWRCVHCARR